MFRIINGGGGLAAPQFAWQAVGAGYNGTWLNNAARLGILASDGNNGMQARFSSMTEESGVCAIRTSRTIGASRSGTISTFRIKAGLKSIRAAFFRGDYRKTLPRVEGTLAAIKRSLSSGAKIEDRLLSYYYTARIMLKVAKYHEYMFREGMRKHSVQILLLDESGQRVLLQKRGQFKRLFADTYTVSANAKPAPGASVEEAAATAVEKEVGLALPPSRLKRVGDEGSYANYLVSYDFLAFSDTEESALKSAADEMSLSAGITATYDPLKRSLAVMTVDPHVSRKEVRKVAEAIRGRTGVEYVYPVFDRGANFLVTCRLTSAEEERVCMEMRSGKRRAINDMSSRADVRTLKRVDSDDMRFMHWMEVRHLFAARPQEFALDLTAPYFGRDEVWEAVGCKLPGMIDVDDTAAGFAFVAGGKGANTHFLRGLTKKIPDLHVPETAVLPINVYERVVLADATIRRNIAALEKATTPDERRRIAETIHDQIGALELPADVVADVGRVFRTFGHDVAVRSSANAEDMKKHTAAGRADSFMHQVTLEGVLESIIRVWQSLFSDGFVEYREDMDFPHTKARMAVLLQKFVSPAAAGVVFSFDPATNRPVYRISAQPGLGEGVVEGEGSVDFWRVGLTGKEILEKHIALKQVRFVEAKGGGSRREDVAIHDPSLSDRNVLRLADIAKKVHHAYREDGRADNIDLEYVLDRDGKFIVVQTRAKEIDLETDKNGDKVFKYLTIDVDRLPDGVTLIPLYDRAEVAFRGAVTARLQVLYGTAADVIPGMILVAHHTNNEFNGVFASIVAVITTDGDSTSHAGQHAYEKKIPCVVGALGALGLLAKYDGRVITFDASARMFVVGACPLKEVEESLSVWRADEQEVLAANVRKDVHEIFRSWEQSKAKRSRVFLEDYEGHWRRRSNAYGHFQLDYYYRAWDRLTEILNGMFASRRPWKLRAQERQIKVERRGEHLFKTLLHRVTDNDPQSIYHYLMGVEGFSVDDAARLFDARWEGFRNFAQFMGGTRSIDRDNVEGVVDNLVDAFVWMHFGFWLDVVVEKFAAEQLQYISDDGSFHNMLRSEAVADRERLVSVDPLRSDVPKGKVLFLSRNKDKEIYAVLERIRSEGRAVQAFDRAETAQVRDGLREASPAIYETIDAWSMRYKNVKEDLNCSSDTDEYVVDLQRRLRTANALSLGALANCYRVYVGEHGKDCAEIESIRERDPEYYLLLKGHARLLAARAQHKGWEEMSSEQQSVAFLEVGEERIAQALPLALKEVEQAYRRDSKLRSSARNMLDAYPSLKRIMVLSAKQLALREDGHHLIVPHQRRIAQMMLEAAAPFAPAILPLAEDVFEISTDEFVGLLQEEDPSYISSTFGRQAMLEAAEWAMIQQWSIEKKHLAEIATDPQSLWKELMLHGYINAYGAIQDSVKQMTSVKEMPLSKEHVGARDGVYNLLKGRLAIVPSVVHTYSATVDKAVEVLKRQEKAATVTRVKAYYRREAERLRERAEIIKLP